MRVPFLRKGETVLKRFLPRSLLPRTLLIVVVPLVLLLVITAYLFYERHWDTISRRLATALAGDIGMIADVFEQHPGEDVRNHVLKVAQSDMGLTVRWLPGSKLPRPLDAPSDDASVQMLATAMDERVRRPYLIDYRPSVKHLNIAVELPYGVLTVDTTSKRLYSTTTYIFMLWMAGTTAVLFVVATLFMRNQVRPIRRLADAADRFGKGLDVPDFKPEGATEVRLAAAAFKGMRDRIERQMTQRTEMLAGVSHDLGTVLTRMKLQIAMLPDSPELAALKTDVRDMEQMVEAYLAFARGEAAEAPEETNVSKLVQEVADGFRRNGKRVSLDVPGGLVAPLRQASFKRCLMNLLANATRHAGHVWVAAGRRDHAIEILIEDDGPGIPTAEREAVFKPFYRIDQARNLATGGAGLGLTIARDVMRRHGGDITLSDSAHGGLNVTLRLPL